MSKSSTSRTSRRAVGSKTDWPRVKAMREADIDLSDIPEITAEMAARGVVRVAGKVVPRGKKRLTMYLDNAIVEFFKARAGARGYQTLINEALKQAVERESLEDTLRRVIREETATYKVGGRGK
ncbi:MAG: BrnA antitoxin family protein [Betaproteobacteria bacterium]|nr:BrnA antitoxin family protein [Betaproteobacteria bacterium]